MHPSADSAAAAHALLQVEHAPRADAALHERVAALAHKGVAVDNFCRCARHHCRKLPIAVGNVAHHFAFASCNALAHLIFGRILHASELLCGPDQNDVFPPAR